MTETSRRYPALRGIAGLYVAAGWLVIIGAAITIIVLMQEETPPLFLAYMFGGGAVIGITLLAAAESIKVFLDIEENTRRSANAITAEAARVATKQGEMEA